VFAGETFTVDQRRAIDRAIREAEKGSGLAFCVRIGGVEGEPRAVARRMLLRMPDPSRSVVVVVDPAERAIEIVTGSVAQRSLSDSECGLAALGMQGSFTAGDLPGGVVGGLQQLGEHARVPRTLHNDGPDASPSRVPAPAPGDRVPPLATGSRVPAPAPGTPPPRCARNA
jgi:hypothetical protein